MEDAQLLAQFVSERSEAAFAELVRRHVNFVYRAALRRVAGDTHLAEDITQLVFVTLARQAASVREAHLLIAWLHGTTRFVAGQALRTEQRRRRREEVSMKMHAAEVTPPRAPADEVSPLLDEAIGSLGARDRQALLLRFFEQRTFAEIGRRMETSEDAARMRVERGLERLRGWMASRRVTSTAAAISAVLGTEAGLAAPAGLAGAVTAAAMSGATASVGLGAAILGFMNTTKVVLATGALALLATGVAVHEWQAHAAADGALARTERELADSRGANQRLRREQEVLTAQARVALSNASSNPAAAGGVAGASSAADAAETPAVPDEDRNVRLAVDNPELTELFIRERVLSTTPKFGPFERSLRMPEERVGAFEQILNESWGDWVRLDVDRVRQGLKWEHPGIMALKEAVIARRYDRLAEFLGPADFAAFRKFEGEADEREMVKELSGVLGFTEVPLNGEQAENLVQALRMGFAPIDPHGWAGVGPVIPTDWAGVMRAAREFLSPRQVAELGSYREYKETQAAIEKIFAQRAEAK